MGDYIDKKNTLLIELTDKANRLWGSKRAENASANIIEAAEHICKVNEASIDDFESPLFHPPIRNH